MTLREETFEAVGGCEKTWQKDLPTTWSREEMKPSFLTTQSHLKHRFYILNASNKILRTRASNRFLISVSSELMIFWERKMCNTWTLWRNCCLTMQTEYSRVSFCDGLFYYDSLLWTLLSRTEHTGLVAHHCRNSSILSLLSALLALFWCTRVSSFPILVQFF